jgi:hypothetical protein
MKDHPRTTLAMLLLASTLSVPLSAQTPETRGDREETEHWVAPRGEEIARVFEVDPATARDAMLAMLEEDGLPPFGEVTDKGFVTEFVPIPRGRFEGEVALPPPTSSLTYPILQPRSNKNGKHRVWVTIAAEEEGTRVGLVAEMYQNLQSLTGWARVDQTSNGSIEEHYLERLEQSLAAPPSEAD